MSARPDWHDKTFDSYAGFVQEVYGATVTDMRPAGRSGAAVIGAAQSAGDWSDAPTPDLTVIILTSASSPVTVDLGAGRFNKTMVRNQFVVTAPGAGSMTLVDNAHTIRAVTMPYAALKSLAGEGSGLPDDGDFGGVHRGPCHDREVARLMAGLWRESEAWSLHGALYVDGALLQLAAALLRLKSPRARSGQSGLASWQVKRACAYMVDNLDQDMGLVELAALVGVSPGHFCTAFRRSTGLQPSVWMLERRVERAKTMIVNDPKLELSEVALATGYNSHSAFGAAFNRATGATPSAWRRQRLL